MNESDRINVLQKLIELTDENRVKWDVITEYLDREKNEALRRYVIGMNKYFYSVRGNAWPMPEEYNSYCAKINGGLVIIFSFIHEDKTRVFEFATQTIAGRLVEKMETSTSYQAELERLWNSAKNTKSIESFFDGILRL